jgi:hypothetical protein
MVEDAEFVRLGIVDSDVGLFGQRRVIAWAQHSLPCCSSALFRCFASGAVAVARVFPDLQSYRATIVLNTA